MADATYIHRVLYLLVRVQQQLLDNLHLTRIESFSDLDVFKKTNKCKVRCQKKHIFHNF